MKTIELEIAGRKYTVTPLPIKQNREWRKRFEAPIADTANLLAQVGTYADTEFETTAVMVGEIGKVISGKLPKVIGHLIGMIDTISDAVFDYCPSMMDDRDYIEEHGFDDEMVSCFLRLLGMAFPFGPAVQGLIHLGREVQVTTQSSASESSESETKNSTPLTS